MTIDAIVTMPPYAPFLTEVAKHPIVSGLRLNTVMPIRSADSLDDVLRRFQDTGKDVWIDLKARQLRVKGYWVPPYTEVEVSHEISVNTPTRAYFADGRESATIVGVDGKKLIMLEGPRRVIGPGESLNICDDSLQINGFLTESDLRYIEAGTRVGTGLYMLSFVEQKQDIERLRELVPDAVIAAKIESRKGLRYVEDEWKLGDATLMAARGDLYIELTKPHHITRAMEEIVRKNPDAILASRVFSSLAYSLEPTCADIGDIDNALRMGYRTIMFGDEICLKRESILSGLNLLQAMADKYGGTA